MSEYLDKRDEEKNVTRKLDNLPKHIDKGVEIKKDKDALADGDGAEAAGKQPGVCMATLSVLLKEMDCYKQEKDE